MSQLLKLASIILVLILSQEIAHADFWTRTDRAWSYSELKQAIHYCRIYPRVTGNIPVFLDLMVGREIDRCMYSLGWVGVAR